MDKKFVINSSAVSDRGLSQKRPQNEDSFLEMEQKGIFAVADGVGGANAGEVASQMAVEILGEAFTNFPEGSDVEHVMKSALEQANSAIHQMSNDLRQLSKMATTVVALHVAGDIATIGHVGDSRLYRLDPEGTLFRETDDHSMVAEEVRAGRMTEEQAENHPSKNIISRALGAEPTVDVDLKTIMIKPNTKFLLCSDGVSRHIGDIELAELLVSSEGISLICQQIKAICFQRGAEDNLTAVIVEVGSGEASADPEVTSAVENDDVLSLPGDDEITVATARFPQPTALKMDAEDDDFLEIETQHLVMPAGYHQHLETVPVPEQIYDDPSLHETIPFITSDTSEVELPATPTHSEPAAAASVEAELAETPPVDPGRLFDAPVYNETKPEVLKEDNFSMFGQETTGTVSDRVEAPSGSGLGAVAPYLGMLFVGALIGLAVYHFALKPAPTADAPPITEMKSGNPQLSSFEDLRRETSNDPVGFPLKYPAPEDAEDYYLQGRAYFLTGDYVKARAAFTEAKNLIGKGDSQTKGETANSKVILSDIAVAMAVINDPLAQKNLKAELDVVKTATPR